MEERKKGARRGGKAGKKLWRRGLRRRRKSGIIEEERKDEWTEFGFIYRSRQRARRRRRSCTCARSLRRREVAAAVVPLAPGELPAEAAAAEFLAAVGAEALPLTLVDGEAVVSMAAACV